MRVIVACCSRRKSSQTEALSEGLQQLLLENEFEVEKLDLPPIDQVNPLRSLAAWRLVPLSGMADSLLCLDAWSAVLRHPRKVVWLDADETFVPEDEEPSYLNNILVAGIRESARVFASATVHERFKAEGWNDLGLDAQLVRSPAPGRRSKSGASALLKVLRA